MTLTANEPLRLRFNASAAAIYAWGTEVTNDSADIVGTSGGGAVTLDTATGAAGGVGMAGVSMVIEFIQ